MLPFAQSIILSASIIKYRSADSRINPELKLILDKPSLLAQRNMINHVLKMMVCMVVVPLALVVLLVTGNWIMRN